MSEPTTTRTSDRKERFTIGQARWLSDRAVTSAHTLGVPKPQVTSLFLGTGSESIDPVVCQAKFRLHRYIDSI